MFFTRRDVESWAAVPWRLINVTACVRAGLSSGQSGVEVQRQRDSHKWFYMTVIGKIIGDSEGGRIGQITVDTISSVRNQPTNQNQ